MAFRPDAPGERQDQSAEWRSLQARRLTQVNVAGIKPRVLAADSQLGCFAIGLTSR